MSGQNPTTADMAALPPEVDTPHDRADRQAPLPLSSSHNPTLSRLARCMSDVP